MNSSIVHSAWGGAPGRAAMCNKQFISLNAELLLAVIFRADVASCHVTSVDGDQ